MKERFAAFLAECPVVAILRGITTAEVTGVCDILFDAGIRLLEIPLNSPDACESIRIAAEHCGSRQMTGAGTVLTVEEVRNVRAAGGEFIISPNADPPVIRATVEAGMISIPGFFTASEGFAALCEGADYLKLFPATLGPGYIKDLQAVIKAPILAVGGVNNATIPDFLKVCAGVGIGGALYRAGKALNDIAADAEAIVKATKGIS